MSEEEEQFQSSNCEKLTENDDKKVRYHSHISKKFRGLAHWSCNVNLQLTKKNPVIFHNLRGYDSHLMFCDLHKFDVKIDVIPNSLQKYLVYFLNKNSVFIDSMEFMNSSLEKLVKNLIDNDFKCFTQEFDFKNLKPLKRKGVYTYEYIIVLKNLVKKNCLITNVFTAL